MRITELRGRIIDNLRVLGGGCDLAALSERIDRDRPSTLRALRRMEVAGAVRVSDGAVTLLPPGYIAIGSFPPKA
ncbi:hypothetical protein [Pseudooceanicola atlanticus]|uniref:HTH iclR-type domain-containing protein n=1 Tax=Pseudooceanicola atlanticus TaxID=1461694 RepID=A0A0A0EJT8_9RHOB|nr:hypothetical protein [Pseudooceanicola atlanticus]KGM50649.1 hypothetical protein ATO9_04020 [Pseudooceanicola atlanticus]